MKGRIAAIAAALLLPVPLIGATLRNEYLRVDVDEESGRIFLSAAGEGGGRSGQEGRPLLFYDRPPSSYTVVSFGSGSAVFGSPEGSFFDPPSVRDGEIVCVWETDRLRTTQTVSFIERRGSRAQDGVLIRYAMKNIGGGEFPAGICVVLDTVLSEASPAHFALSDGRGVGGPLELSGENMPDSWSTEGAGGACLMGVLKGSTATPPARVVFANYRFLRERILRPPLELETAKRGGFSYGAYSRNDSAVALVFGPDPLSGEREYRIVVGLCGKEEFGPAEPASAAASPELRGEIREEQSPAPEAAPPIAPSSRGDKAVPLPPPKGGAPKPEAPSKEGKVRLERIADLIGEIDELIDEIDRRAKDVHPSSKEPPKPIGEEEMRRLKERLEAIEGKGVKEK